jgi:regulatory protein
MVISDEKLNRRLENKALSYLARFASSEANLRQVLIRFGRRKCWPKDGDKDEEPAFLIQLNQAIDRLVIRYARLGYVDDAAYAHARARGMRVRGTSGRHISHYLKAKGVKGDVISQTMDDDNIGSMDAETDAARKYARRRKLGQYASPNSRGKPDWEKRHLASMIRAGFGFDVSKLVLFTEYED